MLVERPLRALIGMAALAAMLACGAFTAAAASLPKRPLPPACLRAPTPGSERYSGLAAVADRDGFIAAFPSSEPDYWNSTQSRKRPDDIRFLTRLISTLQQRLCVDARRTYVTGVSNGGGMAAVAECALSTQIAAIASVAGGYAGQPPCDPFRPVSVLEIHGTAEPIVPYFGHSRRPTADGLPSFVNAWVRHDECSRPAAVRPLAPRATTYAWSHCASGVQVEHIKILHDPHQWPGATPPDSGPPSTFCAACEIWRFFSHLGTSPRRWPRALATGAGARA